MAVPKICGLETEYGIVARSKSDIHAVAASTLLVDSYRRRVALNGDGDAIEWDFNHESPGNDARMGFSTRTYSPTVDTTMSNTVLTNGARLYVDHAHPEISTPECATAHEIVTFDRASEHVMNIAATAVSARFDGTVELVLHKNNSDGKGRAYGCHENYLVSRSLDFGRMSRELTTHFVTRSIYCGSGKVGSEQPGRQVDDVAYQVTQRADFFEERIGLETTINRPIINTRDEPHSDPAMYRRFHVIAGDATMSETATLLKVGVTSMLLAALEDDPQFSVPELADPVASFRDVSRDLTLSQALQCVDGQQRSALDVQEQLCEQLHCWSERYGFGAVGEESGPLVLSTFENLLADLRLDCERASDRIDWIAKKRVVDAFADRHGLALLDSKVRAVALQYHDISPTRNLAARCGLVAVANERDVRAAITEPPETTRAYFRGKCLSKFPESIVSVNWDSIVFDLGHAQLHRIPMMDPLLGTKDVVGMVLAESSTAAELVAALST